MSNKKNSELRKVPKKNYVIFLVMILVTFLLVYYLYRFYTVYSDYQKQTPIIREVLPEITEQELEHYVQESPSIVIYMCTASDDTCRNFEKSLKKLVIKKELANYITYVNLTNTDLEQFSNHFNNSYPYKQKLENHYPALVVFEDSEIRDLLQSKQGKKLTIEEVDQFLKRNKIGE